MTSSEQRPIRWSVVVLATLAVALCLNVALRRIRVDSDLAASIPEGSPVLESGRRLLEKHPIVDRIAIDLSLHDGSADTPRLLGAAERVEHELGQSGLFASVGNADFGAGIGAVHASVAERLPTLFSAEELRTSVAPKLSSQAVRARVAEDYALLSDLEGVGQARAIELDPLGLRELVYARLGALIPSQNVRIEQNQLLSADGRHLLVTAVPHHALADPESARKLARCVAQLQAELEQTALSQGKSPVLLTAAGAYRAAMDNEAIVKQDTERAVWLVTIAISLLLLTCFSRPVLGLLTLLPATAGVAIALLVYSLFARSMSALSLGFGAALISITVDQGIVYIAYLDRVRGASGKRASEETFSAVSLATLTTVGAFLALKFSGYQLLEELGIFAALGSAFSFIFVHTVFPWVFRAAPPTERRPLLPIDGWLRWLSTGSVKTRLLATLLLLVGLGAFARPRFEAEIERINTVTPETRAAEQAVREVWGDLFSRAFVLLEAPSVAELQARGDRLGSLILEGTATQRLAGGFSPAFLWPGPKLAQENLAAWKAFWGRGRQEQLLGALRAAAREVGFTEDAFEAFARAVQAPRLELAPIPAEAYSLLGVTKARDGQGWVWLGTVERGPKYDAVEFARQAWEQGFAVFDGPSFGRGLNAFLEQAFLRMLLVVAPFVLVAVGFSFMNWRLAGLVLAPVVLALICTLGVLGIMGKPVDVPGLMLGVVVLGMGTNFSVYLVRAHQRFPDPNHPVHDSVRVAALLDGGATVLGMATLLTAEHAAAKSAGLTGLLGIGFSLLGALYLLPPLLRATVRIGGPWPSDSGDPKRTVWSRYRYLEPALLLRAFYRLNFDPALPRLDHAVGKAHEVVVVGSNHGIEPAWLIACHPERSVVAVAADPDRERILATVLGDRGQVRLDTLSELGPAEDHGASHPIDAVVLLSPGISGSSLEAWLGWAKTHLVPSGRLVVHAKRTLKQQSGAPVEPVLLESAGFRRIEERGGSEWIVAHLGNAEGV
jgi:predicted exporter